MRFFDVPKSTHFDDHGHVSEGTGSAERRRWEVEVGGFPCTIELDDGVWVVTIVGASVAHSENLDTAILRACGGLVTPGEALELALSIREHHKGR